MRRRGVEARSAREERKLGIADNAHFTHAAALRAAMFTHDHHFVELALDRTRRPGASHYGVIFVELHRLSLGECIRRLALYADVLTAEEMMNRIEFL